MAYRKFALKESRCWQNRSKTCSLFYLSLSALFFFSCRHVCTSTAPRIVIFACCSSSIIVLLSWYLLDLSLPFCWFVMYRRTLYSLGNFYLNLLSNLHCWIFIKIEGREFFLFRINVVILWPWEDNRCHHGQMIVSDEIFLTPFPRSFVTCHWRWVASVPHWKPLGTIPQNGIVLSGSWSSCTSEKTNK